MKDFLKAFSVVVLVISVVVLFLTYADGDKDTIQNVIIFWFASGSFISIIYAARRTIWESIK